MADHQNIDLRIVLVGKTGSGKSATANTILGEQKFVSKISAQAVTKTCQIASREWKGRKLDVVDTPGLFDTKETLVTTCTQISQCVIYSCPGPHAILLVMPLGRYTAEEQNTVALIKTIFGEAAMKYMIVLFTRKEELEGQSLDSFIEDADENLKDIIKECGNRCFAISNKAGKEEEEEVQVQRLVELIEEMVKNNGGAYFSHPIYEETEERLRQCREVLEKICAEQDNEIQVIKEKYASKPKEEVEDEIKSVIIQYEEKYRNANKECENNVFTDIFKKIWKILSRVWHMFWK